MLNFKPVGIASTLIIAALTFTSVGPRQPSVYAGPPISGPDRYGDSATYYGLLCVLPSDPDQAVGTPDGVVTTQLTGVGCGLEIDLGNGEEGTGNVTFYYRVLANVGVAPRIRLLDAGKNPVFTDTALLDLNVLGIYTSTLSYADATKPYRYISIDCLASALGCVPGIDAVVIDVPDLAVTLGQPSPDLVVGQSSSLPVTVTNSGAPAIGPVTVTTTLPSGVSSPAGFTSNGWTCTTTGDTVACTNPGPIAVGSQSFSLPVTPNASTVGNKPVFNTTISPAKPFEENLSNNTPGEVMTSRPVASGLTPTITSPTPGSMVSALPTFSGTADPNSTVTVMEGDVVLCTAIADAKGAWSCTASTPLTPGNHSISITSSYGGTYTSPPAGISLVVARSIVFAPIVLRNQLPAR